MLLGSIALRLFLACLLRLCIRRVVQAALHGQGGIDEEHLVLALVPHETHASIHIEVAFEDVVGLVNVRGGRHGRIQVIHLQFHREICAQHLSDLEGGRVGDMQAQGKAGGHAKGHLPHIATHVLVVRRLDVHTPRGLEHKGPEVVRLLRMAAQQQILAHHQRLTVAVAVAQPTTVSGAIVVAALLSAVQFVGATVTDPLATVTGIREHVAIARVAHHCKRSNTRIEIGIESKLKLQIEKYIY